MGLENKRSVCVVLGVSLSPDRFSQDVLVKKVAGILELRRVLMTKPSVLIFKAFPNSSNNETIVNEVKLKSPKTRIVLCGLKKTQVKNYLADNIESFLDADASEHSLSIVAERIMFNESYNEAFMEDIKIDSPCKMCILIGTALVGGLLILSSYFLLELL